MAISLAVLSPDLVKAEIDGPRHGSGGTEAHDIGRAIVTAGSLRLRT
jgi:hypothetical protein